jgi:hypothetical protein
MPLGWRSILLAHINKWNSEFENTVGPGTVGPRTRSGRRVRDAEAASSSVPATSLGPQPKAAPHGNPIKLGCGSGPLLKCDRDQAGRSLRGQLKTGNFVDRSEPEISSDRDQ